MTDCVLVQVAYLLLTDETLVTRLNAKGESPLHVACAHASVEVVMRLVKHGAPLYGSTDTYEATPLYRSVPKRGGRRRHSITVSRRLSERSAGERELRRGWSG